ncbi:hypothetical protein R6Q59_021463 [Mikania micrantha]|uniref:Uncharacterized protein n=1 Tax=Mikania micrantha TaxID=192012 RepID=A0A5N6PN58_9ASTR|nr:hypothetical protein E3N88_05456 [Mikania micrantha]
MASHNQSYRADEDKGQAEEKAGQMKDSTAGHLSAAKEKAEAGKKKTSGVMQRTTEQVMSMAQGAADKVKQTFGLMAEEDDDDEIYGTGAGATTATRRN